MVGVLAAGGMIATGPSRADGFAISADYTYESPAYSEPDSMFMIDSKPVLAVIEGAVPGMSDTALQDSVRFGMISSPPVVCCAGADKNFKARAPLIMVSERAGSVLSDGGGDSPRDPPGDRAQYRVAWNFGGANPTDGAPGTRITATASLYHGGDLLTQANGKLDLPAGSVAPEAVAELVKTVEGKLTFYPSSLVVPNGGGG
jgi:hypothetical protein